MWLFILFACVCYSCVYLTGWPGDVVGVVRSATASPLAKPLGTLHSLIAVKWDQLYLGLYKTYFPLLQMIGVQYHLSNCTGYCLPSKGRVQPLHKLWWNGTGQVEPAAKGEVAQLPEGMSTAV